MNRRGRHFEVVVIGAGLSGLAAANLLADEGVRVGVIAKGGGFLHFTSGCVDVLGRTIDGEPVSDLSASLDDLIGRVSSHPYALVGRDHLVAGLHRFGAMMSDAGLPFGGDERANLTLPTAIGSTRVTCLAPATMAAGSMHHSSPMLIVGFRGFRDFYPPYLAANLSRRCSFPVRHLYLDLPRLRHRHHLLSLDVARALDDPATREEVARLVKSNLSDAGRVGFPAVLGLDRHRRENFRDLTERIGRPLFEITTLPPSIPGIRINEALRRRLMQKGSRVEIGFWVQGRLDGNRAGEISVDSAGGATTYTADAFVLATGGTGGGGIIGRQDGSFRESVFGLPVDGPADRSSWYHPRFLGPDPQPISLVGVAVNERLQPILATGAAVNNVFVTASNLPHWDPVHEGSGEGVALATAHKAATEVLGLLGATSQRSARSGPERDCNGAAAGHASASHRAGSLS
jgi:glycerol-3-phosphate dehydrogenase subunit B